MKTYSKAQDFLSLTQALVILDQPENKGLVGQECIENLKASINNLSEEIICSTSISHRTQTVAQQLRTFYLKA